MYNQIFDHSSQNIFGGETYFDENNHVIGQSEVDASTNGTHYYDENHHVVGHSEQNQFGGENIYDDNNHMANSYHTNNDSSVDYFNDSNEHIGHTDFNDYGGSFTDLNGNQVSWHDNIFNGINVDPLDNVNNVKFPPFV